MPGLWRYRDDGLGKYLVLRRDNTIPEWISFVLGSRDPAASAGLRAYADKAEELKFDPEFVSDVRRLADEFDEDLRMNEHGDPDAPRSREDHPGIIQRMLEGNCS